MVRLGQSNCNPRLNRASPRTLVLLISPSPDCEKTSLAAKKF
jgi:hypothetical protein